MTEQWKKIAEFPDYEVSDLGNVRSLRSGMLRKPYVNNYRGGYRYVCLPPNKQRRIARLVAAAFIGPCPAGQLVRHLDGVANNDCATNLAYGTPKQNTADRIAHGRSYKGERHPNAKLTAEQVACIRESIESSAVLGERYGVHKGHIGNIRRGTKW